MAKSNAQAKRKAAKPHPAIKKVTSTGHKTTPIANKDADRIVASKAINSNDASKHMIQRTDGEVFTFPTEYWSAAVRSYCAVGQPYSKAIEVVQAAMTRRPASGMAKGTDARNAPHSAKALADSRAKAPNKADARQERAKAKADRKADRASRASPKADDQRKITILKKDYAFGREGTARRASWDACMKSKTVADYAKVGGKLKYLPRWTAAGAIKLG